MKKIIVGVLVLLAVAAVIWQLSNTPEIQPADPLVLLNPSGPTVIPVAGLTNSDITGDLNVEVVYWNNIDEVLASLNKNEAGFAVLPITTGVNIYNRDLGIKLLGVHEWKVFYLIARDTLDFEDWTSLKNKNVYTPVGKGQTADVLMRTGLKQADLEPGVDVNINYAPPQEIVALFREGKVDYAALPEPFVTMAIQGEKGRIVLDFQQYWGELSGLEERIPIAGLFVTDEFLKSYPTVTKNFVEVFNQSIIWSNENPDTAIENSAEILPIPPAIIKTALERIDFYYVPAKDCKTEVDAFLAKIKELDSESIEKLPDSGFYTDA